MAQQVRRHLSSNLHCLSLRFHCISLLLHCFSVSFTLQFSAFFHCLSELFSLPFVVVHAVPSPITALKQG